jgi:2-dehydro-3-deoxygluconokinase
LAKLGYSARHCTVLPDNEIGNNAFVYLKANEIETTFCARDSGRMGLYFMEEGKMQRPSRIIYDRFFSAFANYDFSKYSIQDVLQEVTVLHITGISPAISKSAANFCINLVNEASKKSIFISTDINYRRNLWQYGVKPHEIMPKIIEKSNLIIGDIEDFKNSLNQPFTDFETACKAITSQFTNVTYIAKTNRKVFSNEYNKLDGTLFYDGKITVSKNYKIRNILDRIGGGDAFAAGLIFGILEGMQEKSIEFAAAASVLKHSIKGDANLTTYQEIMDLVEDKNNGKLLR